MQEKARPENAEEADSLMHVRLGRSVRLFFRFIFFHFFAIAVDAAAIATARCREQRPVYAWAAWVRPVYRHRSPPLAPISTTSSRNRAVYTALQNHLRYLGSTALSSDQSNINSDGNLTTVTSH